VLGIKGSYVDSLSEEMKTCKHLVNSSRPTPWTNSGPAGSGIRRGLRADSRLTPSIPLDHCVLSTATE